VNPPHRLALGAIVNHRGQPVGGGPPGLIGAEHEFVGCQRIGQGVRGLSRWAVVAPRWQQVGVIQRSLGLVIRSHETHGVGLNPQVDVAGHHGHPHVRPGARQGFRGGEHRQGPPVRGIGQKVQPTQAFAQRQAALQRRGFDAGQELIQKARRLQGIAGFFAVVAAGGVQPL